MPAIYKISHSLMLSLLVAVSLTGCFKQNKHEQTFQNSQPDNIQTSSNNSSQNPQSNDKNCHNELIFAKFQQQNPNAKTQVLGCGEVIKVLKDDNDGSRHQKFLVKINGYPQITVLIAHNSDLASRVEGIKANTPIRFYGEYIYNDKGGVVHWTHKDPAARHQSGWLEYQGQRYW